MNTKLSSCVMRRKRARKLYNWGLGIGLVGVVTLFILPFVDFILAPIAVVLGVLARQDDPEVGPLPIILGVIDIILVIPFLCLGAYLMNKMGGVVPFAEFLGRTIGWVSGWYITLIFISLFGVLVMLSVRWLANMWRK